MSSGFEYWQKRHREELLAAQKLAEEAQKEVIKTVVEKPKESTKKVKKNGRVRSNNRLNT